MFIDYSKYNYCATCDTKFEKGKGIKCPECNRKARTLPRNPKVFRDTRSNCSYSEIWITSARLKNSS